MPEWSKGSVLSTDVYVRVGSNPTECTFLRLHTAIYYCSYYNIVLIDSSLTNQALMPEWSKGSVLSTDVFVRVGSNPTQCNFMISYSKLFWPYMSVELVRFQYNSNRIISVMVARINRNQNTLVAQLVRALVLYARGRGFKSHREYY